VKQFDTMEDFIVYFEQLVFHIEGMSSAFFQECFINGLKDEIHTYVLMARPQS
jgi:hypothetical protein